MSTTSTSHVLYLTKPLASAFCGGGGLRWFLTRPRFHSRRLQLANSARRKIAALPLSPAELTATLATADQSPGRGGRECYSTDDHFFVLAGDTIIHAAPLRQRAKQSTQQPQKATKKKRTRAKRTQRLAPVPTTQRSYFELLRSHGFRLNPGRKHIKITHPDHPHSQCVMPASASDFRWICNNIRDIRYAFDIDLRQPLAA